MATVSHGAECVAKLPKSVDAVYLYPDSEENLTLTLRLDQAEILSQQLVLDGPFQKGVQLEFSADLGTHELERECSYKAVINSFNSVIK